jgi:hypothetical protein
MQNLSIHENIRQKLDGFYTSQRLPHLLFHGSPGSGKRTLVYDFIHKIYGGDKHKLKSNVMFVNCAHGKGIKFIRDELKLFAKTNIQGNQGVTFKTIVLFNAYSLTIDAQSALRRCIELFSYNTRFFIIVENKHKLLNPILSRFCEIYVPEYMDPSGKIQNLHQVNLMAKFGPAQDHTAWFDRTVMNKTSPDNVGIEAESPSRPVLNAISKVHLATEIYEAGLSCLDLMNWVQGSDRGLAPWTEKERIDATMYFQQIKSEFRSEKLLLLCMLDVLFRPTE